MIYLINRGSTALSTTNDLLTIVGAANRTVRIRRVTIYGLATASAANVVLMQRSTAGVTPGGAITPAPQVNSDRAASFAAYTTWTTQPTLTPNVILGRFGVNANGGVANVYYPPGYQPEIRGTEQLSFRSESGTSNVAIEVEVEEL